MRRLNFTNTQVASSETARDINRGVVLNLIRRRQPISRADLARVSGLQRSTVSLITEQLIKEKWVVYGPMGRLPRGRRPTFLRLNDRRAIIVADLRPNQTTVAVADVNGRFLSQEAIPTYGHPAKTVVRLISSIQNQMSAHSDLMFEGIGLSAPGRVDENTHKIVFAPNLKWPEYDLKTPIEEATGMQVDLDNAANACVLAEVWFGHAEKLRDLVVVTVAEGVGTGVFMNGHLARGMNGMAGEFGHIPLDPDGPMCACGARGCWEMYASNRAALRYYHESGASNDGPDFQDLLTLAEADDPLALKALDKMAHAVGRGMRTIIAALSPEEIVVVGEFTRLWQRFGPIIEAELASAVLAGKPPRVRPAADSRMARLRGTVALVLQQHFGAFSRADTPSEGTGSKTLRTRAKASG
ncbi:MAG TPA: ROK family protein [Terriglobales bacterium]|nr:ROK family protein [Terriglobales bacterium]